MNFINSIVSLFSTESENQLEKDLENLIQIVNKSYQISPSHIAKLNDFKEVEPFLALENPQKVILVKMLLKKLQPFQAKMSWNSKDFHTLSTLKGLLSQILRVNLSYPEDELVELLQTAKKITRSFTSPISTILRQVDYFISKNGLTKNLENALRDLKTSIRGNYADDKKLIAKIEKQLGEVEVLAIEKGDVWSDELEKTLRQMERNEYDLWLALINHAFTANGSAATKNWLNKSKKLFDEIGLENFRAVVLSVFPLFKKANQAEINFGLVPYNPLLWYQKPLSDKNCILMKGLIWTCISFPDSELIRAIGDVGEGAFKKLKDYGARSQKVGNACLYTLGELATPEAVSQLENLRRKVKYSTAQSLIEKSLEKAALKAGISGEELEEISVSDYGLDENGALRQKFGNYSAEIRIENGKEAKLFWFNARGKTQKSTPAEVKNEHADELKDLQKTVKEITKTLQTQHEKFEKLYLQERSWDFEKWKERYLNHPLRQNLTRRLIWEFSAESEIAAGISLDGKIVDQENRELNWLSDSTTVKLWHPLNAEVGEVLVWRLFLEENQIVQPFKQAHREIYVLTDAERQTETYSNRFAAHILKQHQFNSLCQQRSWRYSLQGGFDSHNLPTFKLPKCNLEVEFWVEPNLEEENLSWSGICLFVTTDQVRFYQSSEGKKSRWDFSESRKLLKLEEIPPLVFSEIMRDVDLFVGVTSLGNNANWQDDGENGKFGNYWHDFSFGDLSATAKTRKEILERLIPRLKIAEKCSFEDRFLIVKGDLRTYKIHLGSGNILMSPNDQYLCIVPSRGAETFGQGNVYLPFEGDRTLSIILSKAFMLAEDTKIKDSTITRQIKN